MSRQASACGTARPEVVVDHADRPQRIGGSSGSAASASPWVRRHAGHRVRAEITAKLSMRNSCASTCRQVGRSGVIASPSHSSTRSKPPTGAAGAVTAHPRQASQPGQEALQAHRTGRSHSRSCWRSSAGQPGGSPQRGYGRCGSPGTARRRRGRRAVRLGRRGAVVPRRRVDHAAALPCFGGLCGPPGLPGWPGGSDGGGVPGFGVALLERTRLDLSASLAMCAR